MNVQTLAHFLSNPFIIALLTVLIIIIIGRILKALQRHRAESAIDRMPVKMIPNPDELDRQAYDAVKSARVEVWKSWRDQRDFNPKTFYDISFNVIRYVAAVYYPDEKEPQYKARVKDLLDLNNRIYLRIRDVLEKPMLSKLRRLDIQTILSLQKGFKRILENPIVMFIKDKEVRKNYKRIWDAINIINPWYWLRRYLTEYSIDTAFRYMMTSFATIIGEEAVLLYGKKGIKDTEGQREKLVLFTMIRILNEEGEISSEESKFFYNYLIECKALEAKDKIDMLSLLDGGKKLPEKESDYKQLEESEGGDELVAVLTQLAHLPGSDVPAKQSAVTEVVRYFGESKSR